MTADVSLILLRPKEDGNVGAVARLMRNFGLTRLVLASPRARLGAEARRRAMAGLPILQKAEVASSFAEAIKGMDFVVGTTDLSTGRTRAYLRRSVSPQAWGDLINGMSGRVALVFGPEDNGLSREELALCDALVYIPASKAFPTLNLSHAVSILLYETFLARETVKSSQVRPDPIPVSGSEKEIFYELLGKFLTECKYPAHKKRALLLLFRRTLGRAVTSESEYSMLLGFLRRAMYRRTVWNRAPKAG